MNALQDRLVVVTGAGGALGSGVVDAFVEAGAQVVGVDRHAVDRPGIDARAVDLTDADDVRELFDSIPAPWAVVHTVGGFAPRRPLAELDAAELQRQLTLNLTTSALVVSHALRRMVPADAGRIVLTASKAAVQTATNGFAYSVSKAAVLHLVRMAAEETARTGVRVNAVSPTLIDTPANRAAMPNADFATWPKVADIARTYVFLADPAHGLVQGSVLEV